MKYLAAGSWSEPSLFLQEVSFSGWSPESSEETGWAVLKVSAFLLGQFPSIFQRFFFSESDVQTLDCRI